MKIITYPIILAYLCILMHACSPQPDESVQDMPNKLAEIHKNQPKESPFSNLQRLEYLLSNPRPVDPVPLFSHLVSVGSEQLYAGYFRDAVDTFHEAESLLVDNPMQIPERVISVLYDLIAISYLRMGYQENAMINPTSASSGIPIHGTGIFKLEEGSLKAIDYYMKILDRGWSNPNTVWLLNIAGMTLAPYPDNIPPEWRLQNSLFEDETGFPVFREIAADLGVDAMTQAGGSIVDDFTGNGYLDIMTSSWHLTDQLRFFINNGDGSFSERTEKAGLAGITGGLNMVHGDYTNNGFPDIYLIRGAWLGVYGHHPNSLLRNNGDGTFTDVTIQAGVPGKMPTQTASWGDFNNNGLLDLLVGYESQDSEYPAQLFMNNGDGTFTDIAADVGLNFTGFVKGVVWGDYINNGYLDLYVSRLGQPNLLFQNQGPDEQGNWSFLEVGSEAGVQKPVKSFPVWFWDYNNSGFLDIFVSAYDIINGDVAREYLDMEIHGSYSKLYRNNGDGTFTDVTAEAGLEKVFKTMGANFGDLDNDGYLDFYLGTGYPDFRAFMPSRMFRNVGGNSFQEVTYSGGFGNIQKGHGVSFADLNNNGFQDIYMNMGGAFKGDAYQNLLFENPTNNNNWVTLALTGEKSNRSALNARIRVEVLEKGEKRAIHRHVTSGGSFGGSPLRQEIGLGKAERINRIEIEWPVSGRKQVFENVPMNRFYQVRELSDELLPITITTFEFKRPRF